jgi:type II secretory pathway predicted ATPase ExeA
VKAQVRTSFTARTAGKIDEAHLLDPAQLEEFRLMTNADMDSASPFAGILIGQPTPARQLRMGTFAAFDQRIATAAAGQDLVDDACANKAVAELTRD